MSQLSGVSCSSIVGTVKVELMSSINVIIPANNVRSSLAPEYNGCCKTGSISNICPLISSVGEVRSKASIVLEVEFTAVTKFFLSRRERGIDKYCNISSHFPSQSSLLHTHMCEY